MGNCSKGSEPEAVDIAVIAVFAVIAVVAVAVVGEACY